MQALRIPDSTTVNIERIVMTAIQQQPEIVVFQDTLTEFYEKYLGYEALKESFIDGFLDAFTPEEIDSLVEFYTSPVGEKSVTLTGSISARVFQDGYALAEKNVAELQRMVDQKTEILSGK